jgi:hypothetical protein
LDFLLLPAAESTDLCEEICIRHLKNKWGRGMREYLGLLRLQRVKPFLSDCPEYLAKNV